MAKSEKKSMKSEKHKEEETREQVEKVEEPRDNDVEDEAKDGEEEEVVEKTFEELGLDSRLIRALIKKGIQKPTPIQQTAIPYILEGKDVVARAKTGSGKTLAYLLPLLQKLFSDSGSKKKLAPAAFVLVPSRELCHQVYSEVSSLIELCRVQLKAVQLTSSMPASDMLNAVAGLPDILVSTPACIPKCFSAGAFQPTAVGDSLEILVLDEADLLLSYGYEDDLRALTSIIPRRCQCLLMSATTSSDVEKLKKLILHNPVTLTLQENKTKNEEPVPSNVQQFWVSCSAHDKLLNMLALLKLELVQKKVLMFTNTIDMGFRLKLFLEKFGIKSAILNAELPQNSRLHILEEFNAGLFDYLIATDDNQTKEKDQTNDESNKNNNKSRKRSKPKLDSEFGVVRGIDFKKVHTVINFDMPRTVTGYIHRIGRTGRAYSSGSSISLVSPDEMEGFEEIKSFLSGDDKDNDVITPFPLLTENAIESLRYRAEDVAKSVTKIAVRESRAQDLRNEIINSEKLKSHFESNPRDLDLLKHDKVLSKQPAAPHLRDIPEYLVDPKTKEASKMVKLARAAMGNNDRSSSRRGNKKRSRKGGDPLKSFNPNGPKAGKKESKGFGNGGSKQKKHKAM